MKANSAKIFCKLRSGILLAAALFLSACGNSGGPSPSAADPGYVVTVRIGAGDTQDSLLQKYGGSLLSWYPEQGIAHLKLSTVEHDALMSRGVSLQSTTNGTLTIPDTQAGGYNSWAGGWNSWAGGWNSWVGGSKLPSSPSDNNKEFMQIRLPQAHAIARKFGEGVKVAVVDTGVDTAHPGLTGSLVPSTEWRDFIDNDNNPMEPSGGGAYGHGTAVAGLILQVAPKAKILPIRVLDQNGRGDLDDVIQAINHAVNSGAQVINLSLGALEWYTPLVDAIGYANSRGVWVVASAGNQGQKNVITYPGRWGWWLANVIGVGSVDNDDMLSSFSSYGGDVFSWAPGSNLTSFYPGSRSAKVRGTSFAAPLVAGALALAHGETSNNTVRRYLKDYFINSLEKQSFWYRHYRLNPGWCSVLDFAGKVWCHGAGRLDVERFLRSLPGFSPASNTGTLDFVRNGNFETGTLSNWTTSGTVSVGSASWAGEYYSGAYAARISGTGSLEQPLSGLTPNTTYQLTAWLKVDGQGESVVLGASGFGGSEVSLTAVGWADWVERSIEFKTGSSNTSATIFLRKTSGSRAAFVDLITVTRK